MSGSHAEHTAHAAASSSGRSSVPLIIGVSLVLALAAGGLKSCGKKHEKAPSTASATVAHSVSATTATPVEATSSRPSLPAAGKLAVPALGKGPSKPLPVPLGAKLCLGSGSFTKEYHDRATGDLTDTNWHAFPETGDVTSNGERYSGTGAAFDLDYYFVRWNEDC